MSGAPLRVGAVGTLVWDRIWHPANPGPVEQWGGATYSLSALAAVAPAGWAVVPLIRVGADVAEEAREFLGRMPALELGPGFLPVPEPNNRVELTYTDEHRRGERLTGGVSGWAWHELEPRLGGLDALYVNFISGFEMELETARRVRGAFSGPIYADLHSLFLGCPGAGVRQQRILPRWEEWVACFDAVQLNADELRLLSGGDDVEAFAERILALGPQLVAVTLGTGGALIAGRAGRLTGTAARFSVRVPLPGGPLAGDPTGCGDIWGSTFFLSLLTGTPALEAATHAHGLAACKLSDPATDRLFERLRAPHPSPTTAA
jgi:hypothetical protein